MKTKTTRDPETGETVNYEKMWDELEVPVLRKIKPEEQPTNYWKWACIAILLGTVAGMISLTPKIIETVNVCTL